MSLAEPTRSHRRFSGNRSSTLPIFLAFVFFLFAAPKINVYVGPAPIYLIDLIIILCIFKLSGSLIRYQAQASMGKILFILLGFALLGEIAGIFYSGQLLEPVYTAIRTVLAFAVFPIVVALIRTPDDLQLLLKASVAGLLITGAVMILSSLPQTRSIANYAFGISYLEPAARSVAEQYAEFGGYGVRGRTLIGVSIMSATFVNVAWPLAALLLVWHRPIGIWRLLALGACFLAPFAVFMSYSRGPILGSAIIVLIVLLWGSTRLQGGILRPALVGACVVAAIGVGSSIFMTDRLINRTQAIFEDPLSDERESERLLAYVEPFRHVAEHPQFLIFGEGMGIQSTGRPFENLGAADHALFAKAYYTRGMFSAFLYMTLILVAGTIAWRAFRTAKNGPPRSFAAAAMLSFVALLPWVAFGHAMVSTPRGAMMFSFVLGLVAVAARVASESRKDYQASPR